MNGRQLPAECHRYRWLAIVLLGLSLCGLAENAFASCASVPPNLLIDFGEINIADTTGLPLGAPVSAVKRYSYTVSGCKPPLTYSFFSSLPIQNGLAALANNLGLEIIDEATGSIISEKTVYTFNISETAFTIPLSFQLKKLTDGPVTALTAKEVYVAWDREAVGVPVLTRIRVSMIPVAKTCSISANSATVSLPVVSSREVQQAGISGVGRTPFTLALNCPENVEVSATITDAVNPANRGDVLTLDPTSTARNVGIRLERSDGSGVRYGPDSSQSGAENQFHMGTFQGAVSYTLNASYVPTGGTVTGGKVKAAATVTFNYQ